MKRTPLENGTQIQAQGGLSYTYIIDCVIGDGASSIVYEAHYIDNAYGRHDVRIKECYPYASDIKRNGTELVWADCATETNDKIVFTTAYHKLLDFQNTSKLRNSTAHIFDLCEANGTLYSVMDVNEGKTFEQDDSERLSDILKTTLALARVVEKYHNNGYLHLDIKPSNFLIIPETRELVILFDVDSVISMADIKSGKVKCVSYSKGWAAPEQMQGRIDKLCPATDIYSIGAILFQKVMGRAVENEDIGIFADWDFDSEIFDDVNPAIKRLLRDIFKRTLSANIKRRYQTANELIESLDEALKVAEQEVYLVNEDVISEVEFVGRSSDIANMHNLFANGTKAIFLHGFGGVGKTALARRFAELYASEYDCVQFHRYTKDLSTIIDDYMINTDSDDQNSHRKQLKKICENTKALIIVDNFDVEDDEDLEYMLSLNVDLIFTTRNDYGHIACDKIGIVELEALPTEELVSIFRNEYGKPISDEEEELVEELIEKFGNITILVPIIAKQIIASKISIEEFAASVEDDAFARFDDENEDIRIRKDGKSQRTNSLDFIRAMFNIAGLSDNHKLVLRYLDLLKYHNGLTIKEYRRLTGEKNLNALNDLQFRNWVSFVEAENNEDTEIKVHQLIYDLVEKDWRPHVASCRKLLDNITKNLKITDQYAAERRANLRYKKHVEQAKNRKSATDIVCALRLLDYTNTEDVKYVVDYFYTFFDSDIYKAQYCLCEELFEILTNLINAWKNSSVKNDIRLNGVILLLFILYCMGTENEYRDEDDEVPQDIQNVIDIFKTTVDILNTSNITKKILFDFLKPYLDAETNTEIWLQLDSDFSFECKKYLLAHINLLNDIRELDTKLIDRFLLRCKDRSTEANEAIGSKEKLEKSIEILHQQPLHILLTSLEDKKLDKATAIQRVLSNPEISVAEKNNLIEFAFLNIFFSFQGQTQIKLKERNRIDWKQYIEPLVIHAEYFDQNPISTKRDGGKFDLNFNISRCRLAYIFALIDDPRVEETLEQVFWQILSSHLSNDMNAWWNDKTSIPRFYVDFDRMINVFYNISKSYLILPYIIKYTEFVRTHLPEGMEDIVLFEWHEHIIRCAEDAYKQKKSKECLEIIKKYEQLTKQMLNIN